MYVLETIANLEKAKLGFILGKALVAKRMNVVQQISSLAKLHDDEHIAKGLKVLDKLNNVGMMKFSHNVDLKKEKLKYGKLNKSAKRTSFNMCCNRF